MLDIEKLKEWLGFWKFFLGTFILGLATFLVNRDIQNREIEIKEQEQIAKYIEHAIQDDVGIRLRFAQYFRNVTRSETLRERWQDYLEIVQREYDETKREKERLVAEVQQESKTALEKEALQARIEELEAALNPRPSKAAVSLPSRVYLHVRNTEQKEKAAAIASMLTRGGFSVPGIQVLSVGPKTSELRYFRKREEDYAKAALDLIKDQVDIKLTYIPGYESSNQIRNRHFEIWFSEEAFN